MSAKHPAVSRAIAQAMGSPAPRGAFTELANKLGKDPSIVSRWHKIESSPDPSLWGEIESALRLESGTLAALAANDAAVQQQTDVVSQLVERVELLEHDLRELHILLGNSQKQLRETLETAGVQAPRRDAQSS